MFPDICLRCHAAKEESGNKTPGAEGSIKRLHVAEAGQQNIKEKEENIFLRQVYVPVSRRFLVDLRVCTSVCERERREDDCKRWFLTASPVCSSFVFFLVDA